jgi:hypothetical protein
VVGDDGCKRCGEATKMPLAIGGGAWWGGGYGLVVKMLGLAH